MSQIYEVNNREAGKRRSKGLLKVRKVEVDGMPEHQRPKT